MRPSLKRRKKVRMLQKVIKHMVESIRLNTEAKMLRDIDAAIVDWVDNGKPLQFSWDGCQWIPVGGEASA
jgi:hypothetical protein